MKKIISILAITFCLLFLASLSYAQDRSFKGLFVAPGKAKALAERPTLQFLFDGSLPLNLNGDTLFLCRDSSWGGGVGVDLAAYKGLITLRAETAGTSETNGTFAGAGLFVNIPSLINLISGVNWNATYVNPSIGIVPGYSFSTNRYDTAVVLSILQVTF